MELIMGEKYTLVFVSEALAMTCKLEVTIWDKMTQEEKERLSTVVWFKQRGKRKIQAIKLKNSSMVFKGWDLPLRVDTGGSSFRGNACLNFVGDIDEIRRFIDAYNVNENASKGIVLCVGETLEGNERVVYPEIAKTERHAVIRRVLREAA